MAPQLIPYTSSISTPTPWLAGPSSTVTSAWPTVTSVVPQALAPESSARTISSTLSCFNMFIKSCGYYPVAPRGALPSPTPTLFSLVPGMVIEEDSEDDLEPDFGARIALTVIGAVILLVFLLVIGSICYDRYRKKRAARRIQKEGDDCAKRQRQAAECEERERQRIRKRQVRKQRKAARQARNAHEPPVPPDDVPAGWLLQWVDRRVGPSFFPFRRTEATWVRDNEPMELRDLQEGHGVEVGNGNMVRPEPVVTRPEVRGEPAAPPAYELYATAK